MKALTVAMETGDINWQMQIESDKCHVSSVWN